MFSLDCFPYFPLPCSETLVRYDLRPVEHSAFRHNFLQCVSDFTAQRRCLYQMSGTISASNASFFFFSICHFPSVALPYLSCLRVKWSYLNLIPGEFIIQFPFKFPQTCYAWDRTNCQFPMANESPFYLQKQTNC